MYEANKDDSMVYWTWDADPLKFQIQGSDNDLVTIEIDGIEKVYEL